MEKDFHYHLTYAMAKLTELDNPDVVAYACQFVDDNNEGQFSVDGQDVTFPDKIKADGGHYYPVMTQSLSPLSLDPYVQKYVYVPFHFLPGDNNVKNRDGEANPLSATPHSLNAQSILANALAGDNPYLIGIAAHTYADTWSHQNFTGMREDWNALYPWYDVFKSIVPNIGHAEAGHSPDVISETWIDYRFGKTPIDNKQRVFNALEKIYEAFQKKTRKGPAWADMKTDFQKIINIYDYDERIKAIAGLTGNTVPVYSKDVWIGEALSFGTEGVQLQPGFNNTNWYRFHQAAKVHLSKVADLIKEI